MRFARHGQQLAVRTESHRLRAQARQFELPSRGRQHLIHRRRIHIRSKLAHGRRRGEILRLICDFTVGGGNEEERNCQKHAQPRRGGPGAAGGSLRRVARGIEPWNGSVINFNGSNFVKSTPASAHVQAITPEPRPVQASITAANRNPRVLTRISSNANTSSTAS